ncbi:MAG: M24 family metallopeptidase [Haliea sp.]|uniref:M24 family metallopeptidase n=1 Tax=Haliea sp. TaxID=1932666 RepID=UPI0032EF3778
MRREASDRLRAKLVECGAAGIVLTTTDNVGYLSGFESVMDGWRQPEPISAVFLPASADLPVTLFLPEASLISLVVAAREGQDLLFDRLRTFDFLNFCVTARSLDMDLELPADVLEELNTLSTHIDGNCASNIINSLAECLRHQGLVGETVLFDDMRVAMALNQASGQQYADGLETIMAARSIKTSSEIDVFRETGEKADRVLEFTVGELRCGRSWAEIEKRVAHFMIDEDIDPLPQSPMLFGGSYDAIFRPDLFRTFYDRPFAPGDIAILETQGRYKNTWIDINRTAHFGKAPPAYREQHAQVQRCFSEMIAQLKPGANTAAICESVRASAAQELTVPEKLLMITHSIGRVPLESPVPFPSTGLRAATEGFEVKPSMVLSVDCLYFGSRYGPSHMENVFLIGEDRAESMYRYPLDLIETD